MLKKLLMFAITSGLAAKLYKSYTQKQAQGGAGSGAGGASASGAPRRTAQKKPV